MSRIRSIHPGLWTDEDFVSLSAYARLMLMGLWNECDDKGIFEWKPLTLKMRLLPADNVDAAELLNEIAASGAVKKYDLSGKSYGAVRNFGKFQRPKKPNDIYPATAEILAFCCVSSEPSSDEPATVPNQFPTSGEIAPQMEDGGGKGKEELEAKASSGSGDPEALKPEHFVEAWNDLADRLAKPKVRDITPERRVRLKARIAGYSLDDFRTVLGNVERSPFLRGDRQWQGCTFDWITKKANFQKILEGNYNG